LAYVAGGNGMGGGTGDVEQGDLTVGVKGRNGSTVGMLGPCCAGPGAGFSGLGTLRAGAGLRVEGAGERVRAGVARPVSRVVRSFRVAM
jgi:hypothetical protein